MGNVPAISMALPVALPIELPTTTTCEICFEEKPPPQICIFKDDTTCNGVHSFCQDCMAKHIVYKIEGKTATIRCPGVDCTAVLDPIACRSLIPTDSFVRWSDILLDTWVARQGHRRSVCPNERCGEVIVDECKGGGRQKCPKCKMVFCFGCGVVWTSNHHEICGFEERVFLSAARQGKWQRCPNCRFFVQRIRGCNIITCRCGSTFCYKCGGVRCRCFVTHTVCQVFVILLFLAILSFGAVLIFKADRF